MASTAAACSATPAWLPWNSRNSVVTGLCPSSLEKRMHASIMSASSSSIRATGMPDCDVAITVSTADLRSGNWHTAADIASGMPCSRSRTRVMTPSVPSEPISSRARS